MLAELMRLKCCVAIAGTHGKTTTTSMVAALLDAGGLDPTVINGGIINAYGTNARLGAGDWMVVEADESDGTFLKLPADIAIVTNIDPEHLDHYGTFEAVQEAFRAFVENMPFYGFAVMCIDHPVVQALVGQLDDRRIITYGENPQADVRLRRSRSSPTADRASRCCSATASGKTAHAIDKLDAADAGPPQRAQRHRGHRGGARARHRRRRHPQGARRLRRRQAALHRVGEWNGAVIIDDYGHHPVEIAAVLRAARESAKGQVIAVMQPHRYTRLHDLFEQFCTCFNDADAVIVAPVYPAGEAPIEGVDRDALVAGLRAHGHRQAIAARQARRNSPRSIKELAKPGDYVVCLGAGSITQWAYALPGELKALDERLRGRRAGSRYRSPSLKACATADRIAAARLLCANQSLAELTWFRVGGPAQVFFMPGGRERPGLFPAQPAAPRFPSPSIGAGSNLIVRDGGVPGVVIRLGRGFNEIEGRAEPPRRRRHRHARRDGGARGAGGRHRRPGFLQRHSRLDRRRACA